jgi:hypothetical protein
MTDDGRSDVPESVPDTGRFGANPGELSYWKMTGMRTGVAQKWRHCLILSLARRGRSWARDQCTEKWLFWP